MGSGLSNTRPATTSQITLGSLATAAIFVLLLCWFFAPAWETNDDVGMSMVAHGYGLAAVGSPTLIFSNVIWGYLVRSIPEINGTLGYSIATLGVLIITVTVFLFGLYRLAASYLLCLAMVALVFARPILFPQFTLNAGLTAVAAVILWHLAARRQDLKLMVVGCILAFASYLIRSHELLLVLLVALPLLPWKSLSRSKPALTAALLLIVAISLSAAFDYQAYQGESWSSFNELNLVRAMFTDFGAGEPLLLHPEILQRHGYSANDVRLLQNWFFVDPAIANPQALRAMLTELGPLPTHLNAMGNVWMAFKALSHPTLLPLVLAALLISALHPSRRVIATWTLFFAAISALALVGRPGVLRVYVPLVCLLLIAPFLGGGGELSGWRKRARFGVLFAAAIFNFHHVFAESNTARVSSEQTRKGLSAFPQRPVVIWGGVFPFEEVYPVLGASRSAMSYRFYGLGVFTLAPFSVPFAERDGRGLVDRLGKTEGVPVIATENLFRYLDIYCVERLRGLPRELNAQQHGKIALSQRQCKI